MCGSTTAWAMLAAITPSQALPPNASMSAAAADASGCVQIAMPFALRTACFGPKRAVATRARRASSSGGAQPLTAAGAESPGSDPGAQPIAIAAPPAAAASRVRRFRVRSAPSTSPLPIAASLAQVRGRGYRVRCPTRSTNKESFE